MLKSRQTGRHPVFIVPMFVIRDVHMRPTFISPLDSQAPEGFSIFKCNRNWWRRTIEQCFWNRLSCSSEVFVCSTQQGRQKQSPDGQAQVDVGSEAINNSRAKCAAEIWTLVFLAVRRRSHCTSASNLDSNAWKFSRTERKSCVRT